MVPTREDDGSRLSGPSGLSSLPPPLLRDGIFAFLVQSPDHPTSLVHGFDKYAYLDALEPLRVVCREWYRLSRALLSHARTWLCERLLEKFDSHAALLESVRQGDGVRQLELRMAPWYSQIPTMMNFPSWGRFFVQMPNLVRLDIATMGDGMIPVLLDASSRACPHVRDLVLKSRQYGQLGINRGVLETSLVEALQRWHGTNGGLHALTIPHWAQGDDARYTRFLSSVADWCPEIQYVRGWDSSWFVAGSRFFRPNLPAEVWEEFCRRCPDVRTGANERGVFTYVGVRL